MASRPIFHHYLPSFYQARWAGADGKLRRFRLVHGGKVDVKWAYPSQSGGDDYLYSDPAKAPTEAQWLEQGFMSPLDSLAAVALGMIESDDPVIRRNPKYRSAWTRFLLSLMMRMPNDIKVLQASLDEEWLLRLDGLEEVYQEKKGANDPATFKQYLAQQKPHEIESWAKSLLPKLIDHQHIGQMINNMRWFVRSIPDGADSQLVTSDRPLITWYDFSEPDTYIMLPIGPKCLFVAVNNLQTQQRIESRDPVSFVTNMNRLVIGAAKEFVFTSDDRCRDLISEHFGKKPRTTLFEYLLRYRRRKRSEQELEGSI
ncbi:DUF4238 domain-containing protein [Mesorhizobium sp. M7A.F.Ca.MR.362.00.0.0]|uniref:DUF4238 domain-containing protein n=1 Tax=Mesorhizobium sp. M7A.F.Ca.MR.362.00.0.0 TaxID=2496779 RepID=UPI000FD4D454|nr:DUF4238 domain-containing protein [Mesorhizobium sp. M7A.F.Ca.MR.362.00.0.0]RUU81267.1 DUF4238 domain-containing protein [Mesorhizobium sp. M7A.F.Ca.MR.362.00.0.0]RWN94828.1 MAG: DUF4238 domain-containing protein [Mesorhizobium sp.]